ncbi:MAG: TIGR01777 family protein [Gammaproteobacteria bacterium]|nr:TIGR01777 family protein [Gammaproteobacteria bacterium]
MGRANMAQILLTGATGFIGDALLPALINERYSLICLTRNPRNASKKYQNLNTSIRWITNFDQLKSMPEYIINLAGEGIADSRWTDRRKHILRASRIDVTKALVKRLNQLDGEPSVLISGSAIGYYGLQVCDVTETDSSGSDFAARLCADWEEAISGFENDQTQIYTIRLGVVLGRPGGFLGRLEIPFKLGIGGTLGRGDQMLSWIHRDDLVAMIRWLVSTTPEPGPYNATSPEPISNQDFTKTLGRVLKRPTLLRVPEAPLRMILGELSDLLFKGQSVQPSRAIDQGFQFEYPDLNTALTALFR